MPTNLDTFEFDLNYASTNVGIFTKIDLSSESVLPPTPGHFLLLTDATPILLTNSGFLILA